MHSAEAHNDNAVSNNVCRKQSCAGRHEINIFMRQYRVHSVMKSRRDVREDIKHIKSVPERPVC